MKIDLCFQLQGDTIPLDHAHPLFSALSDAIPELHEDREVGVHPVRGHAIDGRLKLTDRSILALRIPEESRDRYSVLSGKTISIGRVPVNVLFFQARPLVPRANLFSPLVIIKGFTEPGPFRDAVQRQLTETGIEGQAYLVPSTNPQHQFARQVIRIHGKIVVGFAVELATLSAEDSIRVQETGIGGRRHFGCGLFSGR
jgi:CRISPR-associated protein Cas6